MERAQSTLHHCFPSSSLSISFLRGMGGFIFFPIAFTDHDIGSAQEEVKSCTGAGTNSQEGGWKTLKPALPLETCKMKLHPPWYHRAEDLLTYQKSCGSDILACVYHIHRKHIAGCSYKSNWWKIPAFLHIFRFTLVEDFLLNFKCFTLNFELCRFLKLFIYFSSIYF